MLTESKERVALAMQLVSRREFGQAEKILSDLAASGTELAECNYGMGLIRFASGQLVEAQALLERCVKLQPTHANAYYYLGEIAERRQDTESAKQFYRQALEVNPNHAGALEKIGLVSAADRRVPNEQERQPTNGHGVESVSGQRLQSDFYALLRRSEEPVEREISRHLDEIATLIGSRTQRFRALVSFRTLIVVPLVALFGLGLYAFVMSNISFARSGTRNPLGLLILLVLFAVCVVFPLVTYLRAKNSKITCDRDWLLISTGIVSKSMQNVHLFILSRGGVAVHQTLMNRITDDGTLQLQGHYLRGYFRKTELDSLASHFRQLSLLNPTSRNILAAIGELKQIRSGAQ